MVLQPKQLVLLFEKSEHVLAAALDVAVLLARTTALKVLVTSRTPLNISWEHLFPIVPFALPPRAIQPSLEQLRQYDAIRFFLFHAQAVIPDFVLTDDNTAVIVEICHRIDGLPLAIELVAARLRLFSLPVLLQRLNQRLLLLTGGARDLLVRHQTLHVNDCVEL